MSARVGANGQELTDAEAAVLRALDRLVKLWPNGHDELHLTLASMGGTLVVFKGDFMHTMEDGGKAFGADQDYVIWQSSAIPSTGGDW